MTVTAIRLQNFMAFGEVEDENEGWIELRPISLLYGRNSSGKSAIIRALRLLKQSLTEAPEGTRFAFIVEDGLDIGNPASIIHGSNLDRFSYHTGEDDWEDWIEIKDEQGNDIKERKKKTVDFAFASSFSSKRLSDFLPSSELKTDTKQVQLTLRFGWMMVEEIFDLISFTLDIPSNNLTENHTIFEGGRLPNSDLASEMGNWWFGGDSLVEFTEPENLIIWRRLEIQFIYGFLFQLYAPPVARRWITREVSQVSKLLEDINIEIKKFLDNIQYIRPIRPEPQRGYLLDASGVKRWERRGLQAYLKLLRKDPDLPYPRLNTWLTRLQLGTFIKSEPSMDYPEGSVVSKLLIQEKESNFEVNLADVGFGASQVIPILVECLIADNNSLVIIEQPELHLHPEAQGVLADFFITEIANQDTVSGKHFFLETHSEHLLLRLQRRIAETRYQEVRPDKEEKPLSPANDGYVLEPENFGLIFVTRNGLESKLEFIKADRYGQLANPSQAFQDFFRYDYDDVEKLMSNVAKIRKQESSGDNND